MTIHNYYINPKNHLNPFTRFFLAIGCGVLLYAAWPVSPFTMLIFVAWVPLLWLEAEVTSRKKFMAYTYLATFIWNVSTTWWIWNATAPGAMAAFMANSFIMCLPWLGYTVCKKWLGENLGYLSLIAFWMCFEYVHLQDWGLSWPWLTLGNVFASRPRWVQWYEYTGHSGGTLWVWLSNIIVYKLWMEYRKKGFSKKFRTYFLSWILLIIIPCLLIKPGTKIDKYPYRNDNIVVVQPNIDPYEKTTTGTFEAQLHKLIALSEKAIDSNTRLVLWPETALYMENGIHETEMKENFFLAPLWAFLKRHPRISLFTGIESYRVFDSATKYSRNIHEFHFEFYNSSVLLDSSGAIAFYHKSRLVPGVETLPWYLKFLSKWFEKFGGTTGGYTKQDERTVLVEKNGYKIAPAICYESIYGEFMGKYIKQGANLICIITNDGWWKKTPGHKQHMNYARLRTVETRKWVARCANTGISCFIDPTGKIYQPQPYNTQAAIKLSVNDIGRITFFVKNGDILSKIMTVISAILLTGVLYLKLKDFFIRKQKHQQ